MIKPPKLRFRPGEKFLFETTQWMILYTYRTVDEPHVWYYTLEEVNQPKSLLDIVCQDLASKDKTPRIVFEPFEDHEAASKFFWNIPSNGDRIVKSTQELLRLKAS